MYNVDTCERPLEIFFNEKNCQTVFLDQNSLFYEQCLMDLKKICSHANLDQSRVQ